MIAAEAIELLQAGRSCPADYTYSPTVFARPPDFAANLLYVVGGLYGNLAALTAIEQMAAQEHAPASIVFNGDFHWFDAEPGWFAEIEQGVAPIAQCAAMWRPKSRAPAISEPAAAAPIPTALVTTRCAAPTRSSSLLRLCTSPDARERFRALPMHLVARVGDLRVGIVHGDAAALAGWRFAQDELDNPKRRAWLESIQLAANVDLFACTHTCLAALRDFSLPKERMTVINNGAAGMPNFTGTNFGVITRIATSPSPHRPLYGLQRDGVYIDALAVAYDRRAFLDRFLARWPKGSPAHASYYPRIAAGPDYSIAQAAGQ